MKEPPQFPTQAIHAVLSEETDVRPIATPIYLSTTYHRNEDGSYNHDYLYSRADNPNRRSVEKAIASLENGAVAYAFASGMAAVSAVFQSLKAGDHILIPDDVYFNVVLLLREVMDRWQLQYTAVDMADLTAVRKAIQDNTRLIWLESPSNPQLKLTDIRAIGQLAQERKILVAVDNTWPTPVITRPLDLGADLVVHSTTKYFGGHSDVLSGCVVVKEEGHLAERISSIQRFCGGVPAPFDCWLVSRGIQSLHLRVTAQSQTALTLATYLDQHPAIEAVLYPGLPNHPQYSLAQRQMTSNGAMLSVLVKGDGSRADRIAHQLRYFKVATSLGAAESLVERRKAVEGPDSSTPENLLRLSIGLEAATDLIADWERVLK
ncbi:MAG: aminotransferase class I/II-fold pyridoxal phosphate-dependent enzyme [Bacteroidota bacterium]